MAPNEGGGAPLEVLEGTFRDLCTRIREKLLELQGACATTGAPEANTRLGFPLCLRCFPACGDVIRGAHGTHAVGVQVE